MDDLVRPRGSTTPSPAAGRPRAADAPARHRGGSIPRPARRGAAAAALLVGAALLLAGCAAGPNPATGGADPAGFWLGVWHGLITPITFLISLFTDSVNIYEVHNNGNWYDFGYVIGLSMAFGGGATGGSAGRKRSRHHN
jgi:hypothetical protein